MLVNPAPQDRARLEAAAEKAPPPSSPRRSCRLGGERAGPEQPAPLRHDPACFAAVVGGSPHPTDLSIPSRWRLLRDGRQAGAPGLLTT